MLYIQIEEKVLTYINQSVSYKTSLSQSLWRAGTVATSSWIF